MMDVRDCFIYSRTLPARGASFAEFPESVDLRLVNGLCELGYSKLYSHQAEMFDQAQQGKNVVITTSTASGKTISFLLPVLQECLAKPQSRAIFLYPTKALAADQLRGMEPILEKMDGLVHAGVYDGDTPVNERSSLRRSANILLTNPEMLSGSFMPNHSRYGFDFIFSNLKYIVIDELHTYRGVFGSHMANLFRRIRRVCDYYGSHPQILCSSATIANPVELAEMITGEEFVEVSKDGSPRAERTCVLVQPPAVEGRGKEFAGQVQAAAVTAQMIPDLVEEGHSFIAFAKSRRTVEVILREAKDRLDAAGFLGTTDAGLIAGYRGGYTPLQRKSIEKKMASGQLKGLVSTNALELGIDIGSVDTVVLTGYPGTRASYWQQSGRAGRSGKASTSYLILESLPFDQYIAVNPRWLFEAGCENAVVDRDNLLIELSHIRAAAAELPLSLDDLKTFPDLGEIIPILMKVGEVRSENGKFVWSGNAFPAGDFSMRNMDQKRYKLMNKETNEVITEMDEIQAFREIHEGAVYMHEARQYQIVRLDLESRTATAIPFNGNYYTMPGVQTQVRVLRQRDEKECGRTKAFWGDVNVEDVTFMYKKLQFHNHQNLGFEQLQTPLCRDYDSESAYLAMPQNVIDAYRRLLQLDAEGNMTRNNHFDGMCHALKNAVRMVTMTEASDVDVTMSSYVIGAGARQEGEGGEAYLYIYDRFAGGLGYAQKAYEQMDRIIDQAIELTAGCGCKDGCAVCVGDHRLDRRIVLWGLRSLREELDPPTGYKYVEYASRPVAHKDFRFSELEEKWEQFREFVAKTGDSMSAFLTTVPMITVENHTITLYTQNEFLKDWILQDANRRSLANIIRSFTDAPVNLKIAARTDEGKHAESIRKSRDLKDKLQRRYEQEREDQD